jgi:hypothetical protein
MRKATRIQISVITMEDRDSVKEKVSELVKYVEDKFKYIIEIEHSIKTRGY